MKFDLRSRAVRFFTTHTAKVLPHTTFVQAGLAGLYPAAMRVIKSRLSIITPLRSHSALLKSVIFGALALMTMVIIGGLEAVGEKSLEPPLHPALVTSQPLPQGWNRLPNHSALSGMSGTKPKLAQQKSASQPTNRAGSAKSTPTVQASVIALQALDAFMPRQESAPADPSNYGSRYGTDIFGKPVSNQPLIVLHETVGSADSAINTFQTAHTDEEIQVSYHSLIRRDGTIVYIVPPDKRAFGAGNSVFYGPKGAETVRTHKHFPPSVNNFAYHISRETPPGGANDYETHSGYSEEQYRSLAWLVAHTAIPDERITTHRAIDRSESRIDPRSFDRQRLLSILHSLPRPYLN